VTMKRTMLYSLVFVALAASISLTGCKKDDNGPQKYSIGGTVEGLIGDGLVLQNNHTDDLPIYENGPFTFPTKLEDSAKYKVTIESYPVGQTCYIENDSGTVDGADVTDVGVVCQTPAVIGSCSDGSIVYDHNLSNDYEGFHQDAIVTGTVPFTCDGGGHISGSGTVDISVSGTYTAECTEATYSGSATMNVTLDGQITDSQVIIDVDEIWYVGSPSASGTMTDTCEDESEPFDVPLPQTHIQHTLVFPNIDGYTIVQPYIGESGTGYYSWTLYIN